MTENSGEGALEIERRKERVGRVSYGDPIVLHDSSKSRVVFVPFFIPRTQGTDLVVKLITYRKSPEPLGMVEAGEKSVSLQEPAARRLLDALNTHFAVAEHDADGRYLALKLPTGAPIDSKADPAKVAEAVVALLGNKDIVKHLSGMELGDEMVAAFRGAVRLRELRSAVAALRQHLDEGEKEERVFQEWCKRHSWAFGTAYFGPDEVRAISAGDKVDLLLPAVIGGHRDIVELKSPAVEVLLFDDGHQNYYFSSEVSKAIGQCHRYLDVLHEEARKGLRDHPEIVAYHPRATVVIGRSRNWDGDQLSALRGLNARLNGIAVMTYDQLLAQGERLVEVVGGQRDEEIDVPVPFPADVEEIPF